MEYLDSPPLTSIRTSTILRITDSCSCLQVVTNRYDTYHPNVTATFSQSRANSVVWSSADVGRAHPSARIFANKAFCDFDCGMGLPLGGTPSLTIPRYMGPLPSTHTILHPPNIDALEKSSVMIMRWMLRGESLSMLSNFLSSSSCSCSSSAFRAPHYITV